MRGPGDPFSNFESEFVFFHGTLAPFSLRSEIVFHGHFSLYKMLLQPSQSRSAHLTQEVLLKFCQVNDRLAAPQLRPHMSAQSATPGL